MNETPSKEMQFREIASLVNLSTMRSGGKPHTLPWHLAQMVEVGEVAQAIKGLWAWWARPPHTFRIDRAAALSELADMFVFMVFEASYAMPGTITMRELDDVYNHAWADNIEDSYPIAETLRHMFGASLIYLVYLGVHLTRLLEADRIQLQDLIISKCNDHKAGWKETEDANRG